jgi:uncharacterized lipoprotein YehR (DUF1307 family)
VAPQKPPIGGITMRRFKMSKVKRVAMAITGKDEENNLFCSADEHYYELVSITEKFKYIETFAEDILDIQLSHKELLQTYELIESSEPEEA